MSKQITIRALVKSVSEVVWEAWTTPKHITQWMHASDDWECSKATNDLRVGGRFSFTLRAKDATKSFDFTGTYTHIEPWTYLVYILDDHRNVSVIFEERNDDVRITQIFETESDTTEELQRSGWKAILNNFKDYAERLV